MAAFARNEAEVVGRKAEAGEQKPETGGLASDEGAAEDAEVATKPAAKPVSEVAAMPPPDEEGFVWPEGSQAAPEIQTPAVAPVVANAPLPALDELIKRIPAGVREIADDLFRVKFTGVKRVAPASLKS